MPPPACLCPLAACQPLPRARAPRLAAAVILVAHDAKFDVPVLRHVLASPAGYIGMLGSRQRGW
ncbi:MAG: hypothetical protein FJZ47_00615 [Candidatus Tectomicrobia bacterium]|uniref:XdhC Rossmann domain-containing protein n=1 Tax=Tectimicrobiota bacterium TaxID=2528274 RepID=A0A937VZ26_UNCTE|nr:hypothetical protein [Candidatus Tectomicrobia bacterium]